MIEPRRACAVLPVSVVGSPRSQGRNAWRLSDQLRAEVSRLTGRFSIDADPRLRERLDEAAGAASVRIAEAFATDRPQDFTRLIRVSLVAVADVQEGIRLALVKRACVESDLREIRELLSRLYPALSALLIPAREANVRAHRTDQRL